MKKTLRRWINAVSKWTDLLYLNDHIVYARLSIDKWPIGKSKFETAAISRTEPRYKSFTCTAQEGWARASTDDALDKVACHEAIHQVIAPLDDVICEVIRALPKSKRSGWQHYSEYMTEFTVSHLTNIVQDLYKRPKGK